MLLSEGKSGITYVICAMNVPGKLGQRLMEVGFYSGARVTITGFAPGGDPMELFVRGYRVTLLLRDAAFITVE